MSTDPQAFDYYWLPVSVGTVLLVALAPATFPPWRQALIVAVGYLTMLAATTDQAAPGAGFLVVAVPLRRRSRTG
ncbi:hypothetical protein ACTOB_005441 [Actinoplanes oblitus]|uniref:Uncharacterized protein n=1 Tax=Actinoplanes oblitus TaxID=3040509 RepID=A0ABY8W917_9ACTN|nr:hypothetical protein [Actinoplanes oblitus]WIM93462.1 hypothetical protein ACTOB_005441 [Actinoplanes oblitus]